MIDMDTVDRILQKDAFEYADMSQCASVHRKTCGAFSFLRKDVWSPVFIMPDAHTTIGIIVDVEAMWPLLTSMSVIDADTNMRNACSNETGKLVSFNGFACARNNPPIPASFPGNVNVPTECQPLDTACRLMNSGGTMNAYHIAIQQPCLSQTDACEKPYICSPTLHTSDIEVQDNQIVAHIGPQANKWVDLFTTPDNVGFTAISQCKFRKEDWALWIQALHHYYRYLLTQQHTCLFQGECQGKQNYFENEVNCYIYPDSQSAVYKQQNEQFLKSILGVCFISNTCSDQLPDELCRKWGATDTRQTDQFVAQGLARLLSKQLGRTIPLFASILDSNAIPNAHHLEQALAGVLRFDKMFVPFDNSK
jgi:hypothetical protein